MTTIAAGTPVWIDLMSVDFEGARTFYAELFGWAIPDGDPGLGGYTQALAGGGPAAGLSGPMPGEPHPTAWTTYLATPDIAATSAAVEAAGGTVLAPASPINDLGQLAICADPTGAVFGLWQAGTFPGFGSSGVGSPCWFECCTRDFDAAAAFYGSVFDAAVTDDPSQPTRYAMVRPAGAADDAFGIFAMPPEVPAEVGSYWLPYIAVADVDAAATTAAESGGNLLAGPADIPFGRWANVAGPEGEAIGLFA